MKKTVHIRKSRLYGTADYTSALSCGDFAGYKLARIDLDEIENTTGAFCFFDPYGPKDGKPFTAEFPCGKYRPFALSVCTEQGKRIALAGLDGGELHKSVQWQLAFTDEREIFKLTHAGEQVGVTIGSGLGAVCDTRTLARFGELVRAGKDSFHPLDGVVSLDGSCAQVCALKDVRLPVFATGWGEGTYAAYVGVGADGRVKGLLCDFAMIAPPKAKESGQTVAFELEIDAQEAYEPDPKKSDAENNIARYTPIIQDDTANGKTLFAAYSRRGYAYHTAGKYNEALDDYLKAIAVGKACGDECDFAVHAWSLYDNAALIYRESGRINEAIGLYEEAKGISDTFYSGAYAGLIDIYRESKEYGKALAVADEMVAVRPRDPSAYLKRSEIYMACEEYEKAIADLDVLIEVYKLNESVLDKAFCLCNIGHTKEALRVLDTYLLDGRANEIYYNIRAGIHSADGDFSAAYGDLMKSFDVNPDYHVTLERLIESDALLFNFRNVVKWAARYIETRPRSEYGYGVRADAYMHMREYNDALGDYLHLVRISDDTQYIVSAVKAAVAGGNRGIAKKYLKVLRKTDNADYIYAMGLVYLHEKKYARAERYFASALALKEDERILASLVDCLIESGNREKASAMLKKLVRIADGEDAFVRYARIARARGTSADALTREYANRFLDGCTDEGLLERARTYFAGL